jgi:regulator of protease activity HflC (stomatin/prohibitin superfamily)
VSSVPIGLAVALAVLLVLLAMSVRIVNEYERGVIFRLGRVIGAKGPGLFFIIPIVDRMVKVSLRTVTMDIPPQDVITRDNVTVRVNAVTYFNVVDPVRSVVAIENYIFGTSQVAQTTLRSILGQVDLDELLAKRDERRQRPAGPSPNVYLREADLVAKLDGWLNRLVGPANIEATCRALANAHLDPTGDAQLHAARQNLAECQRKLARYRAALEAGGDPAVVNQWIAEITQQRAAAEHKLRELRTAHQQDLDPAQVRALLEEVGDLAAALASADPAQRAQLYQELGISGLYQPASRMVMVTANPGVRRRSTCRRADWNTTPTRVRHVAGAVELHRGESHESRRRQVRDSPGGPASIQHEPRAAGHRSGDRVLRAIRQDP